MGEKRSYKSYTKEFKEEAVALVRDQGYAVPQAARSLGIATNMLYRWKQKIEDQQQGKTLSEDEREELKSLRKAWSSTATGDRNIPARAIANY